MLLYIKLSRIVSSLTGSRWLCSIGSKRVAFSSLFHQYISFSSSRMLQYSAALFSTGMRCGGWKLARRLRAEHCWSLASFVKVKALVVLSECRDWCLALVCLALIQLDLNGSWHAREWVRDECTCRDENIYMRILCILCVYWNAIPFHVCAYKIDEVWRENELQKKLK